MLDIKAAPSSLSHEDSYEQSQDGYNAAEKQDELFDPASRFIIAYAPDSKAIAGFSMFRFDMEDTADDNRQVAVVYWCAGRVLLDRPS
jgi:hypothetical protein